MFLRKKLPLLVLAPFLAAVHSGSSILPWRTRPSLSRLPRATRRPSGSSPGQ